ncbi:acetylglutamate kinase [Paenibacillus sp. GD4]|uniref:acetylglutamate kinase n=1 Tax=Paenibacillus sp. GD4 TaxID=3068890 RepID=UPI0027969F9C|nr:acetylglutamate kinase [Paenibacillus sp. GD4]MDQ1913667.1 acetylglutamate kinase [Paenibacillus sp. GD4]
MNYGPISFIHRQSYSAAWTPSKVELNQKLRALWEQHVYWTRLTVNSIVGRLPDENVTTARLLRNPSDFAAVLGPLYGSRIAAQFAQLLREHLTIAAELVKALQAGNTVAAQAAQKRWFRNADAIAEFLSNINPFWSRAQWTAMMHEHLNLLSSEVAARIAGNYEENVATNDRVEPRALMMADVMTSGIAEQFPTVFSASRAWYY